MRGILLSQMDSPPGLEREFHEWYDEEHIPVRLAVPGISAATRYENVGEGPRWLVIYEIDDLAALQHPAYQQLKTAPSQRTKDMLASVSGFTRYICEQTHELGARGDHRFVGVQAFSGTDHTTDRLEASGQDRPSSDASGGAPLLVRRCRVLEGDGGPWTYFVLHNLASSVEWSAGKADAAWLYRCRSRQEADEPSWTQR